MRLARLSDVELVAVSEGLLREAADAVGEKSCCKARS